jgi:hypothetical protein
MATSARRSLLRQFRQCESFSPFFASTGISRSLLRQFRRREDFFTAISQCTSATIFVLSKAFSLRFRFEIYKQLNFLGEAGVITVLYF